MKTTFLYLLVAWLPVFSWSQNFEVTGSENDIPTSMAMFSDGSLGLVGYTKSSDESNDQLYMIRSTTDGELFWEKAYGGFYGDRPYDICITPDDRVFITGESWALYGRENLFVAQMNEVGDLEIFKSYFQYHRDMGLKIDCLEDGSFILNGYTKSDEDDYGEIMITKLDAQLDIVWQTVVGMPSSVDYGFEIIANDMGYLAIGSAGGFFNSNQVDFTTPQSDILVAQLDHSGQVLWEDYYGGPGHDWLEEAVVVDEEIYLIGSTQSMGSGSFDMLLMKMSMEGDSLFAKSYGGIFYDQGRTIAYGNGKLFLGGVTKKENSAYASANYLLATNLDGDVLWEKVIESSGSDKLKRMVFNEEKRILHCLSSTENEESGIDFWLYTLNEEGQFSSISPLTRNELKVIPNPVQSFAHIQLPNDSSQQSEIIIYNVNGQVVHQEIIDAHIHYYPFSVKKLSAGFYTFLIFLQDERRYTGKFIVY